MFKLPNDKANRQAFENSKPGKLTRRIHLPPELAAETQEERILVEGENHQQAIKNFETNYTHITGWSKIWMQPRAAILAAESVEVILRRHKRLGNFIIFRVWRK